MGEKQNQRLQLSFNAALKFDFQGELVASDRHLEPTCYDPLLLLSGWEDCRAAKLRPGNVHSAEGWDELLLPEIERQQKQGKEFVFRADAAFAEREISEALNERGHEAGDSDYGKRVSEARHRETANPGDPAPNRLSATPASSARPRVGRRRGGWCCRCVQATGR